MAGRVPSDKRDFAVVLEQGAEVDEIFKDGPSQLGSNPFEPQTEPSAATEEVAIADDDSLFCVNRKLAAVEALMRLITRDQLSFGQLISDLLRITIEQVKSEAGSFLELDYQNNCMFFRAAAGRHSQGLLNFTVPLGQGVAGFVCETQQPMALSSVDDSSVYLRAISSAVGFETKNMIAYPVVIRGVTFGCLELLNRLDEPQFTESDKEVLSTICEHAARVIENRLMLAAMSRELAELKGKKTEESAA